MRPCLSLGCWLIALLGVGSQVGVAQDLHVLPSECTLTGPEARQRLVVQRAQGDTLTSQVEPEVVLTFALNSKFLNFALPSAPT